MPILFMNNNQCTPVCFTNDPPLIGHFPTLLASDWLRVTHLAVFHLSSVTLNNGDDAQLSEQN